MKFHKSKLAFCKTLKLPENRELLFQKCCKIKNPDKSGFVLVVVFFIHFKIFHELSGIVAS